MRVLAFNIGHDASACLMQDGKILYYMPAERMSGIKHDGNVYPLLQYDYGKIDDLVITWFGGDTPSPPKKYIEQVVEKIKQSITHARLSVYNFDHHINHAFCSLYNLGLTTATVIVLDGGGSRFEFNENGFYIEDETVFDISVLEKQFAIKHKHYFHLTSVVNDMMMGKSYEEWIERSEEYEHINKKHIVQLDGKSEVSSDLSVGAMFNFASYFCGFGPHSAGKVMGLAECKGYEDQLEQKWKSKVEIAYNCQKQSEKRAMYVLRKALENGSHKDIVLTGGYALNCINNTKFLQQIPPEYTLHIDPIPFDSGQSIGAAYAKSLINGCEISDSPKSIYVCNSENKYPSIEGKETSYDEVVSLLIEGKIIAMHQGDAEAGQRALGNRSILFDPRMPNGKDLVNRIKKRESFRPFGGTVLEEYADEWFNMLGKKSSPYMQYTFDIRTDKIPAITHYNGTSRIQTVNGNQNAHLYNLIKAFYEKTGVPILGNTSLNLAGYPLVQSIDDAIKCVNNSEIDYLYFPEISQICDFNSRSGIKSAKTTEFVKNIPDRESKNDKNFCYN